MPATCYFRLGFEPAFAMAARSFAPRLVEFGDEGAFSVVFTTRGTMRRCRFAIEKPVKSSMLSMRVVIRHPERVIEAVVFALFADCLVDFVAGFREDLLPGTRDIDGAEEDGGISRDVLDELRLARGKHGRDGAGLAEGSSLELKAIFLCTDDPGGGLEDEVNRSRTGRSRPVSTGNEEEVAAGPRR